jgi:uncharacterized protein DUF6458
MGQALTQSRLRVSAVAEPASERRIAMGIGSSLVLIAAGAILRFAVSVNTNGVDLRTVGLILLIIGIAGLLISFFWMAVLNDRRTEPGAITRRDLGPTEHDARF